MPRIFVPFFQKAFRPENDRADKVKHANAHNCQTPAVREKVRSVPFLVKRVNKRELRWELSDLRLFHFERLKPPLLLRIPFFQC
jgi:hypothetical protein